MEAPRIVTAAEARAYWYKNSDEGGCNNYTHEARIKDLVNRGLQYLNDKGAACESRVFDREEGCSTCRIAGTVGNFQAEVKNQLGRGMPRLVLHSMDVRAITPSKELYLHDVDVFGQVMHVDEGEDMCILMVIAVGLDERGEEISLNELIKTKTLTEIKRIWRDLETSEKAAHLTKVFQETTSWQIFQGLAVPHDYASDVEDICNPHLLDLLYDDKATYEALCKKPDLGFNFTFVPGPPGCGKTHYMLTYIAQKESSRFVIVAHSNDMESEMSERMQAKGEKFTTRRVLFLGRSLKQTELPFPWAAIPPIEMEESVLQEVAEDEGIIVIGTVKKLDDLRKACRSKGFTLRFEEVLHDEFVRQQWLDFFTIAKLAKNPCPLPSYRRPKTNKVHSQ